MTDEEAVLATLEDYADAYCAKDIMRLMAVFDDGDDISLIGTGVDEFCERRSGRPVVSAWLGTGERHDNRITTLTSLGSRRFTVPRLNPPSSISKSRCQEVAQSGH
jgi:hypothetical protein